MFKLKNGDKVIIIAGKEKGKKGKIIKIFKKKRKVHVKNINIVKKHFKKKNININNNNYKIIFKESKIDISNVSIEDPILKCPTKIKIKKLNNGNKIRICKKSNTILVDKKKKIKLN
ncbi:MAG: 50S ribosomal protein L24 [Candidatus Shikimatogenerans bostrichidophilus]|nr:MAG: 50S ribosomal protein L24 [Candidatus Shikimatogenerans bostrichidophilus]